VGFFLPSTGISNPGVTSRDRAMGNCLWMDGWTGWKASRKTITTSSFTICNLWKFCHILMHFKGFGLGAVFHNCSTNFLPIDAECCEGLLQRMLHQRIIWGAKNTMYTMSKLLKNENKQLCDDQRLRNQSCCTR